MANIPLEMKVSVDFEPTDMLPGQKGRAWQRNLLLQGSKTDTRGFSLTDMYLRMDPQQHFCETCV